MPETPYPDEVKAGLGWTPCLSSKNADVAEDLEELRFARKLYPLEEETALV